MPSGLTRLRVVASDARSNPNDTGLTGSRLSDAVVVDNTPPVIGDIAQAVQDGIAKILQGYTDWEQIRAISI